MIPELQVNDYTIVRNFIDQERAIKLGYEFMRFCEEHDAAGDNQAVNSNSVHNYLPFLELLCEKTPEVSKIVGETVLPTYVYSRVYKNGSDLKRHTDKDECEISLTLNLCADRPWKIWIETPRGEKRSVMLAPGDAMFYHGCNAPHWRDNYTGTYYTQAFLHYVYSRGDRVNSYFDKNRPGVNNFEQKAPKLLVEPGRGESMISDYIMVIKGLVPEDLCDDILKEFPEDSVYWEPSSVGAGDVREDIRNCNMIGLSRLPHQNMVYENLDSRMFECAAEAIKQYRERWPGVETEIDTGYDLLRYRTGEFYTQHTDSFKEQQRSVTCSFHLNDDYEGGEFAFFNREKVYKFEKGDAILFPSNFMFPHEILPVTSGTRYSIITWYV